MPDRPRASPLRVALTVTEGLRDKFCLLTGTGFRLRSRVGCTVREFLCRQLGVSPDYLAERIQTLFLNGLVVDDPNTAIVTAGATLALSAAMPGLAGAMLRKGSRYAPMRSQLTYDDRHTAAAAEREGDVVVKLFNMVQREFGPEFLRQGIQIPGLALCRLLRRRPDAFRSGILAAEIAGEPVSPDLLFADDWAPDEILLTVRC
jgi:hypothetical protein